MDRARTVEPAYQFIRKTAMHAFALKDTWGGTAIQVRPISFLFSQYSNDTV